MRKLGFVAGVFLSLTGCLGYHLGTTKPGRLRDVHSLAVPTFHNRTLIPRIEVLITDTVIKQLQQDGTFRIATENKADAVLQADIVKVARSPARSVRGNVLATVEFNLAIQVHYKLIDRAGNQIGSPGDVIGTTSFFVGTDVTTDERQALPLATEELATRLVSQLSEGW